MVEIIGGLVIWDGMGLDAKYTQEKVDKEEEKTTRYLI